MFAMSVCFAMSSGFDLFLQTTKAVGPTYKIATDVALRTETSLHQCKSMCDEQ